MNDKKQFLALSLTGLVTASLLVACSSTGSKDQADASAMTSQAMVATTPATDKPGRLEGELVVVTATVKAINKKDRVVTLTQPDGKESEVKCGPEVRNFAQIRVGDIVTTSFLETVELFVSAADVPSADGAIAAGRAPLGSKPGFAAVKAVEVSASVVAIDYQTREVKLKGPDGKTVKMIAGPEVKRLNEVKVGDTVVARLTRAASIEVSAPTK
ncbi:MAG: hypothetical protein NTV43_12180 [Methylococcales bacterium]|nr:hypothetical protein [Methylococcales bacterium]